MFLDTILGPFIAFLSLFYLLRRLSFQRGGARSKSVAIIVLGDIGRSPRMLYHAQSFVDRGYHTHIVAYAGSTPPEQLLESPLADFVYLPTPLAFVGGLPRPLFLLLSPFKVLAGSLALLWTLLFRLEHAPAFMFVQNPPAIPTLPIVKVASLLRGSKVIIDWHNTGYSVLSLRLGSKHPVVQIAKWIEQFWGRDAYAHLCVTEAMKTTLVRDAKIQGPAVVFHDRPPAHFRHQTDAEAADFLFALPLLHTPSIQSFLASPSSSSASKPTAVDKPAILVSATSWTPDEDFSLLLRSLDLYNTAASTLSFPTLRSKGKERERLPKVVMIITGKGAGKSAFEQEVKELEKRWEWVRVRTAWLPFEDYPKLLGSANLGISLHTSTSGADLPMKVVDMFGCGLPVCALDFACIDELVRDGVNGRTFKTAEDLADQLVTLLKSFPTFPSTLDFLRAGIKDSLYGASVSADGESSGGEVWCNWSENWDRVVGKLIP